MKMSRPFTDELIRTHELGREKCRLGAVTLTIGVNMSSDIPSIKNISTTQKFFCVS